MMKNDEQVFFKIEDYLKGKLPADEAADFEREMAADRELAETVEMHRFEREGLEYMIGENLRAKMKDWETNPPADGTLPAPSKAAPNRRRWLGLLAVAMLGVVAFFVYKNQVTPAPTAPAQPVEQQGDSENPSQTPPSNSTETQPPIATDEKEAAPKPSESPTYAPELIALSKAAYGNPSILQPDNIKGQGGNEQNALSPAKQALGQTKPDYKKAIGELLKINQQQYPNQYGPAQELLAHAYYNDGQYGKAAAIFQKMTEQKLPAAAHDEAEWYLMLSLLPDYGRQKSKVDELLQKISYPENYHEFADDTAELKDKLAKVQR